MATGTKKTTTDRGLLGTPEACAYLGVSRGTLLKLRDEGRIAYYMVGDRPKFRAEDLEAYLEAQRREARA